MKKVFIHPLKRNRLIFSGYNKYRDSVTRAERLKDFTNVTGFPAARTVFYDHHLAHAAACYGLCGMDEKILVLTCDGYGDYKCATVNVGHNGRIEQLAAMPGSDSIATIYSYFTQILGMRPLEDEYKVMGMAPYSRASGEGKEICKGLLDLFEFPQSSPLIWRRRKQRCPPIDEAFGFFKDFMSYKRFDHVCEGLQLFTEKMLAVWTRNCILETGIRKVALSGGIFMNVKANKIISELDEVEEISVFPSCGDESNAFGAAYILARDNRVKIDKITHLYFGTGYDNASIEKAVSSEPSRDLLRVEECRDIEKRIAELLKGGEIVARFKGRMEFGARALGNRSILADPRRVDAVRRINDMIKKRDFWMPFAPTILEENQADYLVNPKKIHSPFMMFTFDVRPHKTGALAACLHPYDFTTRPQILREETNPDYYKLIKYFRELTQEGAVLNTSFNLHGSPIVESPHDALEVFINSGLKYLALGDFLIEKR